MTEADFEIAELPLAEPGEGEVRVRNRWMSVDPYMRLSLSGRRGVHAPMGVGDEMSGAAVGVVEASNASALPVGALVSSQKGWRDRFVAPAAALTRLPDDEPSPSWRVGILGLTGITAYAGIEYVLQPGPGDTIFVSGAAGAVGSIACQLAKRRGARVLGSAGSDRKCRWLIERSGVDEAVNYHTRDVGSFLKEACPTGLDHYFDNVGGSTLDAAMQAMRPQGRIGLCGAIAQYNDGNYRAGPSDFFTIIEKGLTAIGFNAGLYNSKAGEIIATLSKLLANNELFYEETFVDGLENAPAAFMALFSGENTGKMVIRLD